VLENLIEEEGMRAGPGDDRHAVDHAETILRFCRATGLTDEQVKTTVQLASWQARSYYFLNVVREEPFPVIMAVLSTQEGQQPAINSDRMLPPSRSVTATSATIRSSSSSPSTNWPMPTTRLVRSISSQN